MISCTIFRTLSADCQHFEAVHHWHEWRLVFLQTIDKFLGLLFSEISYLLYQRWCHIFAEILADTVVNLRQILIIVLFSHYKNDIKSPVAAVVPVQWPYDKLSFAWDRTLLANHHERSHH